MLKSVRLAVFVCLILFPDVLCLGQDYLFTVIASSGKVLFSSKDRDNWTPLTAGSKLLRGDRIKLEDSCYLGLCYFNGRTLELAGEGLYLADALSDNLAGENTSVTKKFTDFIMNEIIVKNKSKDMKYLSAVARQNLTYIDKDFPSSTILIDSIVTFRWYPVKNTKVFAFRLMSPASRTVLLHEVQDTSVTVNISPLNLQPDSCYMWYVFDPENPALTSDSGCIRVPSMAYMKNIQDSLRELKNDLTDEKSPLNQIIIATFFENNHMALNALEHYDKALPYFNQIEEFQKKYILFLIKTGLFKRADIMMEKWNTAN
ncbi:MAG: hypothetical protein ACM3S2_12710 [Ignavibacteriales bacterium]